MGLRRQPLCTFTLIKSSHLQATCGLCFQPMRVLHSSRWFYGFNPRGRTAPTPPVLVQTANNYLLKPPSVHTQSHIHLYLLPRRRQSNRAGQSRMRLAAQSIRSPVSNRTTSNLHGLARPFHRRIIWDEWTLHPNIAYLCRLAKQDY